MLLVELTILREKAYARKQVARGVAKVKTAGFRGVSNDWERETTHFAVESVLFMEQARLISAHPAVRPNAKCKARRPNGLH